MELKISVLPLIDFCPKYPDKFRMGTDYVFSVTSEEKMTYEDGVEFCRTKHNATQPIFYTRKDANLLTIDQELELNGE